MYIKLKQVAGLVTCFLFAAPWGGAFFITDIDYLFSSIFANENNTDDINDWYGTCCCSANCLILSRMGRGIRIFITQSDLLKVRYAAYSRSNDSMFIMNNC